MKRHLAQKHRGTSVIAAKVTIPVPSVRGGGGEGRKKRELWWGQDTWRGFLGVWPHFIS